MRRGDVVIPRQIRNRSRDLQNAVERARRELQLLHRRTHERLSCRIQPANHSHVGGRHVRVAVDVRIVRCEPRALSLSCSLDPRCNDGRGFAQSLARELFVWHTRHFDMNINPVEQRPADPQGPLRLCAFGSA
jgi:hypothetical protein